MMYSWLLTAAAVAFLALAVGLAAVSTAEADDADEWRSGGFRPWEHADAKGGRANSSADENWWESWSADKEPAANMCAHAALCRVPAQRRGDESAPEVGRTLPR